VSKLIATDIKIFVPAKNFEISLDFYKSMGWAVNIESEELAELELAGHRFYLQNYYKRAWANNFMLHVTVEDAQAWYELAAEVVEDKKYAPARARAPREQDYGALVSFVWDPSGVLIHFAEMLDK
jgi:hypothetical protein